MYNLSKCSCIGKLVIKMSSRKQTATRSLGVLIVTNYSDSSCNNICWYACVKSIWVNCKPTLNLTNNSYVGGNFKIFTYSNFPVWVDHGHHRCSPFRIIRWDYYPHCSNRFNSFSTFSFHEHGNSLALQNFGVELLSNF